MEAFGNTIIKQKEELKMHKNYKKHSKKFIVVTMVLALLLATGMCAYAEGETLTVQPTNSKVLVNGEEIAFEAYIINDNNYFKLRDLAKVVSGTEKQFNVEWNNEKKAIELISNSPYTEVGGELSAGDNEAQNAILNTSAISKDGQDIVLAAYTINNNNYFKLRDIAQVFNIGVTWDQETKTVGIDTTVGYEVEAPEPADEEATEVEDEATEEGVEKEQVTDEAKDASDTIEDFNFSEVAVSSVSPVSSNEIKVTFEEPITKEQAGIHPYSIVKWDIGGYEIVGEVELKEGDAEVVIEINAVFQYEGEHVFYFEIEDIENMVEIPFNITPEFIGEID